MTSTAAQLLVAAMVIGCASGVTAAPTVGKTVVLGPFTGHGAPLHPDNMRPQPVIYYGTDLGWSYEHGGKIHFLFGDTWASAKGEPIGTVHDDMFGIIDLAEWPDASRIGPGNVPTVRLAQNAGAATLAALDAGLPAEGLKTPLGAFSDGSREFALFITGKPEACRSDDECSNGLTCDTDLGYVWGPPEKEQGLTFACAHSRPGCSAGTKADAQGKLEGSGFCVDKTSTLRSNTDYGRVGAVGMKHVFGVRSATQPQLYTNTHRWLTNKFINAAVRVADKRVYFWGRPHFVGVNAKRETLAMYFAYAEMPRAPDFALQLHYFTGTGADGAAQYSVNERDAVPVDLDSTQSGVQSREDQDIVQQMSVVWMAPLSKWVMFYGGGVSKVAIPQIAPNCGVLEIFARNECKNVVVGNGAIRMRTADEPWGPWTPSQDVIVGGDADARPVKDEYASGGVLYHPACTGAQCQTPSTRHQQNDYGWLYGANIIEQWTKSDSQGVDVIWNASTWDPYRVILLKTRINR